MKYGTNAVIRHCVLHVNAHIPFVVKVKVCVCGTGKAVDVLGGAGVTMGFSHT